LGTILKVNVSKCKVRQDDLRGNTGRPIGTSWTVPFELIYARDATGQPIITAQPAASSQTIKPITDFWIMDNKLELEILGRIYNHLSPENLSGDGERPLWQIRKLRAELDRKLRACFVLLEREVDETECYNCLERVKELAKQGKTTAFSTLGG
jgi:hypothetical protein